MAEQEFDPHINIPIPIKEIDDTYVFIRSETYQQLKNCIELQESLDHLNKSYDDRILDMLLSIFKASIYRMYRLFGDRAKEIEYSHDLITLYLRPQTYCYLKIYTFIIGNFNGSVQDVDAALNELLEKEITQITVKKLQIELDEMKAKLKERGILG